MSKIFILLFMIMMHIVDDYYLQGILASMKQKSWWKKQSNYKDKYSNDYLIALMMHAFSWAFCIMLPIAINLKFEVDAFFAIMLGVNFMIHAIVDNFKANELKINLVQDQTIHIIQILITFAVFCLRMNIMIVS